MKRRFLALFAVMTLGFLISACTPEEDPDPVMDDPRDTTLLPESIIAAADEAGTFTTLLAALEEADLTATLEGDGAFTVFAPTDEAFAALLTALDMSAAELLSVENLDDILLYHVLDDSYMAEDVVANAPFSLSTLEGSEVDFSVSGDAAFINGVEIVTTDIETENGVIHVIEDVLLPLDNIVATATDEGEFTTLLAALDQAGLTSTLEGPGAFTVFAPTDDAFASLLTALDMSAAELLAIDNLSDVLLYHVLDDRYLASDIAEGVPSLLASLEGTNVELTASGEGAFINGIEIVTTNILTTNGVIHVIEDVLLPLDDIVATAEAAGGFTILLAALEEAGLADTLAGAGSYTVFAPTDTAFMNFLNEADLEAMALLGLENLGDILLYHVLDGSYLSSDVVAGAPFSLPSLQGDDLSFTVMDGKAYVNGIEIVTTDILTTNGVIHVIDGILLPEFGTIVETAEAAGNFTTLLAALDQAGLRDVLNTEGEAAYTVFAPTDEAFAALLSVLDMTAAELLAIDNLADVLLYHVLDGVYLSGDVVAGAPFSMETLQGSTVDFTVMDGKAYINGVEIVVTDIATSNGVIHVIEEVILPLDNIVATASDEGNFTTLLAALDQAGLTSTLEGPGAFTLFAPTDDAFAELLLALGIDAATLLGVDNLSDILLYHVLDGIYFSSDVIANAPFSMATLEGSTVNFTFVDGDAFINGIPIVTTDILTTNGVIHVIEDVLLPLDNIVATAEAAGSFTTLLAALDQAGLTSTLEGPGAYTVFAPTDDAFLALLTSLNIDANTLLGVANLSDILLYHVISDTIHSSDFIPNDILSLATLQGGTLEAELHNDGSATINGIPVLTTNILTTNGVIHVIDGVLLPLEDIASTIAHDPSLSTLQAALVQEGLDAALMGSGPFTVFAPTNDAFDALLLELNITLQDLLALSNLDQILQYHVLTDVYYSGDVVAAAPVSLASLQGSMLDFTVVDGTVFVNGIAVSTADVITTNGVIHIIDGVLLYE